MMRLTSEIVSYVGRVRASAVLGIGSRWRSGFDAAPARGRGSSKGTRAALWVLLPLLWGISFSVPAANKLDNATLERMARAGDAAAQYHLGQRYKDDKKIAASNTTAVDWFRKSAEQGYAPAQFELGLAYNEGVGGLTKDLNTAHSWFLKSAKQGYPPAEYNVAVIYLEGIGVQQNDTEAAVWMQKAATQDYPAAEYALGMLYKSGQGVAIDDAQSQYWLDKARQHGYQPVED
jgi:TPR repeat protein